MLSISSQRPPQAHPTSFPNVAALVNDLPAIGTEVSIGTARMATGMLTDGSNIVFPERRPAHLKQGEIAWGTARDYRKAIPASNLPARDEDPLGFGGYDFRYARAGEFDMTIDGVIERMRNGKTGIRVTDIGTTGY